MSYDLGPLPRHVPTFCASCGMEATQRVAKLCFLCADGIIGAACREGWKIVDGKPMKPCVDCGGCNPLANKAGVLNVCNGTGMKSAGAQARSVTFFCQAELKRKGEQSLSCTLPAGHAGAHAEGGLNWRNTSKEEK